MEYKCPPLFIYSRNNIGRSYMFCFTNSFSYTCKYMKKNCISVCFISKEFSLDTSMILPWIKRVPDVQYSYLYSTMSHEAHILSFSDVYISKRRFQKILQT